MLSGVKFIPRDQLSNVQKSSDFDSSLKERRRSKTRGKDRSRRKDKKRCYNSSDDEVTEKLGTQSKRRKKWYSSDASSSSDQSESESSSGKKENKYHKSSRGDKNRRKEKRPHNESSIEDVNLRVKKKLNGRKKQYSSDGFSSSASQSESGGFSDMLENEDQKGQRRSGREKDKGKSSRKRKNATDSSDDNGVVHSQSDKELARKGMGLDWMLRPLNRPDTGQSTRAGDTPEEPETEEVKRMNPKELNPYFRDDGSGFPDDTPLTKAGGSEIQPYSVVGDGGASWRMKALKRAQEQAVREGRKLDEVVEERWGSLGQLAVSVASHTSASARAHLHAIKNRQRGQKETSENADDDKKKWEEEKLDRVKKAYLRGVSARHPEMRQPKVHDSLSWRNRKGRNMSAEDSQLISAAASNINKFTNDGSFLDAFNCNRNDDAGDGIGPSSSTVKGTEDGEPGLVSSKSNSFGEERPVVVTQALNPNQLAAKVLQLRMKGKHDEADKLLKESEAHTMMQSNGSESIIQGGPSRFGVRHISSQQKKKEEEDTDIHLAKKIMQNKQYSLTGRADDEYDFDDVPGTKRNRKRSQADETNVAERSNIQKRILTQQEQCHFCFDSPSRPKHLVISIANFTYLMLPKWQPVVQGHCCILPMQHESSTRNLDDNVWEELRNFKKCLLRMFAKQDKDVIFLETAVGLAQQRRHCLVECIPLPREIAEEAPLYFKKAIDEAEEEWSQHNAKKLIDTSVKGLRGSIPKNFPYFHVEFGLSEGFVHVIDDEKQFKTNLGLNVIRGILRLPEEDMYRRRQHEPVAAQTKAVASFAQQWEPFDWTKELD